MIPLHQGSTNPSTNPNYVYYNSSEMIPQSNTENVCGIYPMQVDSAVVKISTLKEKQKIRFTCLGKSWILEVNKKKDQYSAYGMFLSRNFDDEVAFSMTFSFTFNISSNVPDTLLELKTSPEVYYKGRSSWGFSRFKIPKQLYEGFSNFCMDIQMNVGKRVYTSKKYKKVCKEILQKYFRMPFKKGKIFEEKLIYIPPYTPIPHQFPKKIDFCGIPFTFEIIPKVIQNKKKEIGIWLSHQLMNCFKIFIFITVEDLETGKTIRCETDKYGITLPGSFKGNRIEFLFRVKIELKGVTKM